MLGGAGGGLSAASAPAATGTALSKTVYGPTFSAGLSLPPAELAGAAAPWYSGIFPANASAAEKALIAGGVGSSAGNLGRSVLGLGGGKGGPGVSSPPGRPGGYRPTADSAMAQLVERMSSRRRRA
jgi:hypothetical protein